MVVQDGPGTEGGIAPTSPRGTEAEACHYVATNHRPGAVLLAARCSFLGTDTAVRCDPTVGDFFVFF